jgi:hypothetical protein
LPNDEPADTFLEIRRPGDPPRRVRLDGGLTTLGRAADAAVALDHPSVSRHHAELGRDATGRWWIRDRGSRNGTTLNGARVHETGIGIGDVIGVGDYTLRLIPAPARAPVPPARPDQQDDDAAVVTLRALGDAEAPRIAAEHISGIMAFGQALQRTPDPRERLRRLLEFAVGPELQGLAASALRLTESGSALGVEHLSEPVHRASSPAPNHISLSLLRAVVARGQPVVANNLVRLPQFQAEVSIAPGATPFSAVACPLHAGDVRDVLYVVQPPQLGSVEWLMLNSLAVEEFRQADAVWAARAEAESRAAVARELDLARVVQVRTVPRRSADDRLDWALSFLPCHGVGGDYVDVIRRGDGSVLLAIADVSGKGMQAALVTAAIHAVFHTLARTDASLADVASAANRHLRTFLPEGGFATLAAVQLDPASGVGECVNCGHPPVLAAGGPASIRLISGGDHLPLGLADDSLTTEPFQLAPGECLVLHTDGLSELRDRSGDMVGLRGLREHFARICTAPGGCTAERVVADVSAWLRACADGGAATDDQTFLIARRA